MAAMSTTEQPFQQQQQQQQKNQDQDQHQQDGAATEGTVPSTEPQVVTSAPVIDPNAKVDEITEIQDTIGAFISSGRVLFRCVQLQDHRQVLGLERYRRLTSIVSSCFCSSCTIMSCAHWDDVFFPCCPWDHVVPSFMHRHSHQHR